MKMQGQMENLTKTLESIGIEFEQHEGGMVTFRDHGRDCTVFPSQTYDGKLFVRFTAETRVDTAIDALVACGVLGD
jgi:hypothetical protein